MKLNPNGAVPLYQQLKNELLGAITNHIYACDEQIPSEQELSQQYGVSRITVRQAVQELCEDGWLVRRQGKGTFVQQRRITRKLEHMMSFTQSCAANNMTPSTVLLECRVGAMPSDARKRFRDDGQFFIITRLRLADGLPVMLDSSYYPMPQYAFLEQEDLSGSLYRILDRHGVRVHANRDMVLDVTLADAKLSERMHISRGTPVFLMQASNYSRDGALVHYSYERIVCERYQFTLADYIAQEEDYNGL